MGWLGGWNEVSVHNWEGLEIEEAMDEWIGTSPFLRLQVCPRSYSIEQHYTCMMGEWD